jgi:hypothetical protein
LDFSELILVDAGAEAAQLTDAQKTLVEALAPLTDEINTAIGQAQNQFGNPGLVAGFGAVEGRCTASPGSASGDATLANSKVVLQLPTGAPQPSITLLKLPVHPKPNTHLTTNLSDVLELILDAVSADLNDSFDGALEPVDDSLVAPLKANLVKGVRDNLEENLAPLEANLIDVVLNRQTRKGNNSIRVSALDLSLLPAAAPQLGASAASLQIGNADCGPGRGPVVARPQAAPPKAKGLPTGVSAGYASAPGSNSQGDDHTTVMALGAFALLMTAGAGFVTVRRLRG